MMKKGGGHLCVTENSYAKRNLAKREEHGAEVVALRCVAQPLLPLLQHAFVNSGAERSSAPLTLNSFWFSFMMAAMSLATSTELEQKEKRARGSNKGGQELGG